MRFAVTVQFDLNRRPGPDQSWLDLRDEIQREIAEAVAAYLLEWYPEHSGPLSVTVSPR